MDLKQGRQVGRLIAAGRRFAVGARAAQISAFLPQSVTDAAVRRFERGVEFGQLDVTLPDGSKRILQGAGPGPHAALTLVHWRALWRLKLAGSVGWYQAWLSGDWTSDDLVALFAFFSANRHGLSAKARSRGPVRWLNRILHRRQQNDRSGARRNVEAHYDLGNAFYAAWLDETMSYSSALFDARNDGETIESAQRRKIEAILDRLNLSRGARLLEIGSGWGGLAMQAIERFGVTYTGLTLSAEQAEWARQSVGDGDAQFLLQDYRDATGQYDAIASVEMVEAVGHEYWPDYLDAIARLLRPGGRAAIQYIAIDDALFADYAANTDFIQTMVFPGGCLLSVPEFRALAEARGMAWMDQVDFPHDYARTLSMWRTRYDTARAEGRLPAAFDANFDKLWRYYLMYCEGGFRGGGITVAQVTLVKI
ncbi:MAG: cyclopropane-fatty-acyl-phospholipid synthase family protein [Sphingopyxis sp.]